MVFVNGTERVILVAGGRSVYHLLSADRFARVPALSKRSERALWTRHRHR